MSNDDFWTTLAAGHTNTVLAGSMDTHLSGKSIEESFGSVRTLTDMHRAANALVLPVEAGTKVVFAGNLGAHMSYDDVPANGITGEVVTVKSAGGEITHHDGKVFVKWADGKFRPIHAEHLRLAGHGKTAGGAGQTHPVRWSQGDLDMMKLVGYFMKGKGVVEAALRWMADGQAVPEEYNDVILAAIKRKFDYSSMRGDVARKMKHLEQTLRENPGVLADKHTGEPIQIRASDLKADFEKIKALAEKRPDSKFLKSLLKQMADEGFAPTDKQMAVVKKIEGEAKEMATMQKELKSLSKAADFDPSQIGKKKGGPLTSDPEDKNIMGHFGQGDLHGMTEVAEGKEGDGNLKTAFRVASLGDLTDFLRVAEGALIHTSTRDLWSYGKDADGNYLVSRLFDDEGEPLKA